jgi:hypothetical protein
MTLFTVDRDRLRSVGLSIAELAQESRVPYPRCWRAANGGVALQSPERRRINDVIRKRHREMRELNSGAV